MIRLFTAAAIALLLADTATAATRAVSCDACGAWQMSRAATEATGRGTVYVFDRQDAEVRKYRVYTEWIDTVPPTTWTHAREQTAERAVRDAFSDWVDSRAALAFEGAIVLPPDFPVRSVAGALLDGAYASTSIESYLRQLPRARQHLNDANALLAKLLQVQVAGFDLSNVLAATVFTVEFPDGSTMDFEVDYSINPLVPSVSIELSPAGNARTADGRAAPTHAYAFQGRTFDNEHGALQEWIFWARHLGIPINGSGTTMTCEVDGNHVTCTVRKGR